MTRTAALVPCLAALLAGGPAGALTFDIAAFAGEAGAIGGEVSVPVLGSDPLQVSGASASFTLIEPIVVIAIVAVLIATVLPALQSVRDGVADCSPSPCPVPESFEGVEIVKAGLFEPASYQITFTGGLPDPGSGQEVFLAAVDPAVFAVPLPATLPLLAGALVLLALRRR